MSRKWPDATKARRFDGPCAICEAEFTPRTVIIRADQDRDDLGEVCEDCLRCLIRRTAEDGVPVPWPTFEEYQALVESHPEPMFASSEEMEASGIMNEHWPAYEASWLWTAARWVSTSPIGDTEPGPTRLRPLH